jgi:hypothetical protein
MFDQGFEDIENLYQQIQDQAARGFSSFLSSSLAK